jgi:pimeloyl-ACP methyl ester carboxylesterase
VGWVQQAVVLAGLSFGGGVAQHYALRYPGNVERLVLLASAGQPEPTWRAIPMFVRLSSAVVRNVLFPWSVRDADAHSPPTRAGLLTRLRGKLWIARKYPQHDLPDNIHHLLRRLSAVSVLSPFPLLPVWFGNISHPQCMFD